MAKFRPSLVDVNDVVDNSEGDVIGGVGWEWALTWEFDLDLTVVEVVDVEVDEDGFDVVGGASAWKFEVPLTFVIETIVTYNAL